MDRFRQIRLRYQRPRSESWRFIGPSEFTYLVPYLCAKVIPCLIARRFPRLHARCGFAYMDDFGVCYIGDFSVCCREKVDAVAGKDFRWRNALATEKSFQPSAGPIPEGRLRREHAVGIRRWIAT